jgi:hypothetical protein
MINEPTRFDTLDLWVIAGRVAAPAGLPRAHAGPRGSR